MKYQIWDRQLNQYFSEEDIFDNKKQAVERLISFFSIDCEGNLTRIRAELWKSGEYSELEIRKVKE